MAGPNDAEATIDLLAKDAAGNWPMTLSVSGLPALPKGSTYTLWLTKDGKLAESCGSFVVAGGTTEVPLNAPYPLKKFDGWVVVKTGTTQPLLTHVGLASDRASSGRALSSGRDRAEPDAVVRTQYEDFARLVLATGRPKHDRTGTGTVSIFGHQMRFDLAEGFPLVTTKKVHFPSIAYELLWFLRGDSNVRWLQEHGVSIWDEWAAEDGDLGPVYGVQWRSWPTPDGGHVDQIAEAVRLLRDDPDSRRIIVSAWNVADLPKMALAAVPRALPVPRRRLRARRGRAVGSAASSTSAAPTSSSASRSTSRATRCSRTCSRSSATSRSATSIWTGGDCHIYDNHREQIETQLARDPFPYPTLRLARRPASIFDYAFEDFEVLDYEHHPAIRAPVAV